MNRETKEDTRHSENKQQTGKYKPNHISNQIKCEWIKHFNQKAISVNPDKKASCNYTASWRKTL